LPQANDVESFGKEMRKLVGNIPLLKAKMVRALTSFCVLAENAGGNQSAEVVPTGQKHVSKW
jgi:hypothetical protein